MVSIDRVSAQPQVTNEKLFDAKNTIGTGPQTSPAEAISFASKEIILSCARGDTAVISSTPDGQGEIVIDNFLSINGENACIGVTGQVFSDACFGPIIADFPFPEGVPITDVLTPIPSIDVSRFIPLGRNRVLFELRDFGVIAGNTDLFLVTTCTVNPPPPVLPEGPDLVVEADCGAATQNLVRVRNIGNVQSGSTTASASLELVEVTIDDQGNPVENITPIDGGGSKLSVPSLNPGDPPTEVASFSTGTCPQVPTQERFCRLSASVDQEVTSEECKKQVPPKNGLVCETDEGNNFLFQGQTSC